MANRRLKRMGLSEDCAEALERANIGCAKVCLSCAFLPSPLCVTLSGGGVAVCTLWFCSPELHTLVLDLHPRRFCVHANSCVYGCLFLQDLMNKNRQELVSLLGLHAAVCDDLLSTVATNICPEPRSVTECIVAKHQRVCFLPTGLVSFDATLRGGLPCGGITEVVGPAGAGKTQFCLQSCVRAIGEYEHDSAIYVDTVCLSKSRVLLCFPKPFLCCPLAASNFVSRQTDAGGEMLAYIRNHGSARAGS